MDNSDKKEFARTIQLAAIAYDKEIDKSLLAVYFEFLEDYSIEQIKLAMKSHCKGTGQESKFFPKVADIAAQINGTQKESEQSEKFQAEAAWLSIPKAIAGCGVYRTPSFKDPITTACVSVMGWKQLCGMTEKDTVWKQKEFVEHYQNFSKKSYDQLPNNIQGLEGVKQLDNNMTTILTQLDNLKVEK